MHAIHNAYYNDCFFFLSLLRYGFKTVELNGENEKNQWAENQIHTFLITRVSTIMFVGV